MTPLQIAIGGLALIVGLLAFAQRLGNWQNKQLARVLSIITAGLFVAWCFLLFQSWVGWLTATVLSSICAWFLRTWMQESEKARNHAKSENANSHTNLKIHSAFYGIGNARDVNLTETLQNASRNALWLYVDNGLIPGIPDPAPNQPKRLTVEYSFGNDPTKRKVVCDERTDLVLPQDKAFIERTAAEYDKKRRDDLAEQAAKYNIEVAGLKKQLLESSDAADLKRQLNELQERFSSIKLPHLRLGNVMNLGFVLPNIYGAGITITNDQQLYAITAYKVRAAVRFTHISEEKPIEGYGIWHWLDGQERRFSDSVCLGMGEFKELLLFLWDSNTVPRDFRTVNQVPPRYEGTQRLQHGLWSIEIALTADNLIKQTHKATVTLTPSGGIPGVN